MGKNKSAQTTKVAPPAAKTNGKTKDVRVTKATEAPKVAGKATKRDSKQKVKEPSPSSDSESDASDASSAEDDSDVSSDSEVETVGAKLNGDKSAVNGVGSESSDSGSDDDSADGAAGPNATFASTIAADADSSEGSSSDTNAGATTATKTNGVKVADESDSSDSDSGSDGSSESSDNDEDATEKQAAAPVPAKKRKAEAEEAPVAKKTKTETATGSKNPTSKNLFVGNLSWNVDEDWLRTEFAEFGELAGVRIITDRDSGRSKGFGYVEFNNESDAVKAQKAKHEADLDGRALNVDFSTPRDNDRSNAPRQDRVNQRANKFGDAASVPSDTLFVGNISFSATAELFQETFGEYGNITRVALPTDQDTGALKGFGYVGFTSVEEAQAAMEALNGADIAGRNVRLDFATARSNDGGSRGGFRGGRGGGDRGGRGRGNFRGGRGDSRGGRGGRGGGRGGRGGSSNRGGVGDFSGKRVTF